MNESDVVLADTEDPAEAGGESSRVAEIVDWVARSIIEGRLQPGDDLNSVELARRFGVSRTPVREALFVLHRERMVDWSPRRRPRVAAMSLKDVREVYHLRALLYAEMSLAIVEHATEDDIASLWRAYGALAQAASQGDVDAYFWANVAFRDEELRVSRNAIFKEVLDSMRMRTNRMRHLSTSLPGRMQRSCADHLRLCEAYAERDGTLAAALNRSIVIGALKSIENIWVA
ncbi:GntR family transcriptional regulator [Burkholderia sp. AU16741]|uniref:GntR family transcriptional regulator n=1 Tax=unclassified Burkholderia TaxID=2613784 RepID=UPI000B7A4E41|nr:MULTISPECIES: GntR family transcriptional regulator [unclassified Burkholderia]MDN7427415.1 GntR family transcriptional regulator [Burkholderia sp. AU45388]OXI30270.1 GntR family transcriptional regulator [Burkholderia sp. AU16741]